MKTLITTVASFVGEATDSSHLDVIYSNQYVFVLIRRGKGAHEIDAPAIKDFYFQDEILCSFRGFC